MNVKTKYILPALILGTVALGASVTYAYNPGMLSDMTVFSGFSTEQQVAIKKTFDIRQAAEVESEKVLEGVGLNREDIREAMQDHHEAMREKMGTALKAGDYEAYSELVAGSRVAGKVTETMFNKLVEAHKLRQDGDMEGAREIIDELGFDKDGVGHGPMFEGEMKD